MPDSVLKKTFSDSTLAVDPELKQATSGNTPAVELEVDELKNVDPTDKKDQDSLVWDEASGNWKVKQGVRGPQGKYRLYLFQGVSKGSSPPATPAGVSYDGENFFNIPSGWSVSFPSTQASDPDNFDIYESFSEYDPASPSESLSWSVAYKTAFDQGPPGPPGPQGPQGPDGGEIDFNQPEADIHQDLKFAVEQKDHVTLFTFSPEASFDVGLGDRIVSKALGTQGAVGLGFNNLPSGVVALSNNRIIYSENPSLLVRNIWLGETEYSVESILIPAEIGGVDVVFSHIEPSLPASGNWENFKFEFSDGSFSPPNLSTSPQRRTLNKKGLVSYLDIEEFTPSKKTIYPSTKEIIKAGDNVTITADDASDELTISTPDPTPTDSAETVKLKLESLSGNSRLDASAVKNLPSGGGFGRNR